MNITNKCVLIATVHRNMLTIVIPKHGRHPHRSLNMSKGDVATSTNLTKTSNLSTLALRNQFMFCLTLTHFLHFNINVIRISEY